MNFGGNNNGQAAQIIINLQMAETEADAQRRFHQATGISCCKDAREFYLRVLEDGRFSVQELRHAIRQGSIRWDDGATQPTIVMPWMEPLFATPLFGIMGLYIALSILAMVLRWDHVVDQVTTHAFLFAVVCTAIMALGQHYILEPRRVALRVKNWMATQEVE